MSCQISKAAKREEKLMQELETNKGQLSGTNVIKLFWPNKRLTFGACTIKHYGLRSKIVRLSKQFKVTYNKNP